MLLPMWQIGYLAKLALDKVGIEYEIARKYLCHVVCVERLFEV